MTTPTEFVLWLNGAAGVMGLYDPALSPKASCVSDKSDDRMDALAMAVNYAKEAK